MADYYLHKTAAHIDELLEKVEGLNNYDDTEVRGLINNKVDKETGKGLSTNDFTDTYKTELDGLDTALNGKVDKETGKGLSTNDFTTSEKTKLNGIESGAEVNVQSDWNQTDTTADDYIKNKPTVPAIGTCTTAGSVAEKVITMPQGWTLHEGAVIAVRYSYSHSSSVDNVTLNVGGSGAKSIYYTGAVYTNHQKQVCGYANHYIYYVYDGTYWSWMGWDFMPDIGTMTQGQIDAGTDTVGRLITAKLLCDNFAKISSLGTLSSLTTTAKSSLVAAINELDADKVDAVSGKELSSNDFTDAEKTKLSEIAAGAEVNVQSDWSQSDSSADDYIKNKPIIPTVNDATLTIQKNGAAVGTFSANAATAATINITVPVDADDVSALPDTTKYGASLALSIDSSTYIVTATLKDQDGNMLGTVQTIDLPLETVVVGGSYDDTTKKVILTLKNGTTVDFSVADLVSGLQTEITSTNKLDADLVDDTTSVHKFVTAADKTAWNAKSDFSGSYNDLTNKPTIPAAQVNTDWNATSGVAQILNKPILSAVATSGSYNDLTNKPVSPTVDQMYDSTSANAQSGVAIESKKPGLKTTGKQYVISSQTVTAGTGAEVFNDLDTNKAAGQYSHAEGQNTTASGDHSHAEGYYTAASGDYSHAEGAYATVSGDLSHAEGYHTKAASDYQHVQGKYNVEDSSSKYAFIIGNGTGDNTRHNAFAIGWNGLIYVNGADTGVDVSAFPSPVDINAAITKANAAAPQSTTYTKNEIDTSQAAQDTRLDRLNQRIESFVYNPNTSKSIILSRASSATFLALGFVQGIGSIYWILEIDGSGNLIVKNGFDGSTVSASGISFNKDTKTLTFTSQYNGNSNITIIMTSV